MAIYRLTHKAYRFIVGAASVVQDAVVIAVATDRVAGHKYHGIVIASVFAGFYDYYWICVCRISKGLKQLFRELIGWSAYVVVSK